MAKKRKSTTDSWETEQDSVWIIEGNALKPSLFFLKWWQSVAELNYGDQDKWLDAAVDLGYVSKLVEPDTGRVYYEPVGFDYDHELVRNTIGVPEEMPLVNLEQHCQERYSHMWDVLLNIEGDSSD